MIECIEIYTTPQLSSHASRKPFVNLIDKWPVIRTCQELRRLPFVIPLLLKKYFVSQMRPTGYSCFPTRHD